MLSTKQCVESNKILARAISQTKAQAQTGFLHLKFLSKIEATTKKTLDLPEYWQPSDFVQN